MHYLFAVTLFLMFTVTVMADEHNPAMQHDPAMHNMAEHMNHMSMSDVGMIMPVESATRTMAVTLSDDMKIDFGGPADIQQDEIIHFVVSNVGKLQHEFSISSLAERKEHAEKMREMPNMKHESGNVLSLAPGETKEITWHFMGKQRVIFACNMPGHGEAGMMQMVVLSDRQSSPEGAQEGSGHNH